ncbi:MAG: TonB-dependent receptor [Bacteroidota bacterium]
MRFYFILICCALTYPLQAQDVLTGRVTDADEVGLESAYLIHLPSGKHCHTNYLGEFILEGVKGGDSIQVNHLGFASEIIQAPYDQKFVTITLAQRRLSLKEVVIASEMDALEVFAGINLRTQPVNSSQEILRRVPGLIIGQHAGGGKAEQIFLRGFDIDHGTDINLTVDGMPVNMVSHAHGQGYADLHFLIPETVEGIRFGKGPYYADQGNFTTAGFVDFRTKDKLESSMVKLEAGQFNTRRLLGMLDLISEDNQNAYAALEYLTTDGPFESSQHFNRLNFLGKYNLQLNNQDRISLTGSYFTSSWDASGQIPQRAIDQGIIGRFDAIDDTEGGQTSRANLRLGYDKMISPNAQLRNIFYYTYYDFELYSNFTFFLNNPTEGDQIAQRESRNLFGFNSEYTQNLQLGSVEGTLRGGIGMRNDQVQDNELSRTANRQEILERVSFGDVNETNLFAYANADWEFGKLTINTGLRVDAFQFTYLDELQALYDQQTVYKEFVSPKVNLMYQVSSKLQAYAKFGRGFHSNDTRVVVAQGGEEILPAALGSDVGFIWKPLDNILVNAAYWQLELEQEFVYVGDEGIVEPGGRTRRRGVDLSVRYQPLSWLYWDADFTYSHARAIDEAEGEDFIPLAPDFTLTSGLSVIHPSGLSGGVRMRYLDDRPANEDNSIVANGYTVVDVNASYRWKAFELGFSIENVMDVDWDETQFATESRLREEAEPVEEIHLTPGTPFFFRGYVSYRF